jgi:hypothetical protein
VAQLSNQTQGANTGGAVQAAAERRVSLRRRMGATSLRADVRWGIASTCGA